MFCGSYQYNVDPKNRVCIPPEFRDEIGSEFYCRASREPVACIYCFGLDKVDTEFVRFSSRYRNYADYDLFESEFYSNLYKAKIDTQGRITITQEARNKAQISDNVYVIGSGTNFRIMSAEVYESRNRESDKAISKIRQSEQSHYDANISRIGQLTTSDDKLLSDLEASQNPGGAKQPDNGAAVLSGLNLNSEMLDRLASSGLDLNSITLSQLSALMSVFGTGGGTK